MDAARRAGALSTGASGTDMLQQLQQVLPAFASPSIACAVACVAGTVLWLTGACYSRSLLTLVLVGLGTWAGKRASTWLGSNNDGVIFGIAAAIVTAIAAYTLDKLVLAIALALLMAACLALVCWAIAAPESRLHPPAYASGTDILDYAAALWQQLPAALKPGLPISILAGLAAGGGMGYFHRPARILFHSLLGVLLIAAGIAFKVDTVPASATAQVILMALMVSIGAAVQMWLCPAPAAAVPADEAGKQETDKPGNSN